MQLHPSVRPSDFLSHNNYNHRHEVQKILARRYCNKKLHLFLFLSINEENPGNEIDFFYYVLQFFFIRYYLSHIFIS